MVAYNMRPFSINIGSGVILITRLGFELDIENKSEYFQLEIKIVEGKFQVDFSSRIAIVIEAFIASI